MVLILDGNLELAAHVESKRGLSTFSLTWCVVHILDGNSENGANVERKRGLPFVRIVYGTHIRW